MTVPDYGRPQAFIQWKGTNVCMDCECVCGNQFHIDAMFAYFVRCHHCGQSYETGWHVQLVPLNKKEEQEALNRACGILGEDEFGNTVIFGINKQPGTAMYTELPRGEHHE